MKPKPKPSGPGGVRKGAGRKPLGAARRDRVVQVLLTRAELAAVKAAVKAKPHTVSSWFRDHGLAPLGLSAPAASSTRRRRGAYPGSARPL